MKNGKWDQVNKQVSASIYLIWRFFKTKVLRDGVHVSSNSLICYLRTTSLYGHNGIIPRTEEYVKLLRSRSIRRSREIEGKYTVSAIGIYGQEWYNDQEIASLRVTKWRAATNFKL